MLYGHVHDTRDEILVDQFVHQTRKTLYQGPGGKVPGTIPCQMINCFCMFSDYTPLTLDEWIEVDAERRAGMRKGRGAAVDGGLPERR